MVGYPELMQAAVATSIKILIKGIELSTSWKKHDVHILGYQINPTLELNRLIQRQVQSRINRAVQIGNALNLIGISDAYDKACRLAGP